MSKAEFIIEHFVKNVVSMLNGQAKAMIVTASRASVVRYKYAIDAYLKTHPEYDREKIAAHLQFKVPGEPLVAFSDKISGEKCIMPEDAYLESNPFAMIKINYDYTEINMNNLGYQSVENAFEALQNRLLIVANKFQTGFNQPKLCAMYIDKHISNDVEIVQTYSRLNRTYPGKDKVFIIDFVNDPETVLRAFKKYDVGAVMEHAQNLEIVYEIKKKLDESDIYTPDEFESYKVARYQSISAMEDKKDVYRQRLYKSVSAPAERWISAFRSQQNAYITWKNVFDSAEAKADKDTIKQAEAKLKEASDEIDNLIGFRKKLKKYCSAYTYISQIVDFGDPDLEVFYGFAKLLSHRIAGTSLEEIDVKNLVLSDYRINKLDVDGDGGEGAVLKPMKAGGKAKSSKQESLKAIIAKINEIWGDSTSPVTGARALNAIADYVAADDISRIQIRNSTNSKEAVIADGRLESIIKLAAVSLKNNDFEALADRIINDPQTWKPLAGVIFDLVDNKKRLDIPELKDYMKKD
jgi:type I restriction enzyme R subunit